MGFKDFTSINQALLEKQYWRLISNPTSLWAEVLKGIYFPNKPCLDAGRGPSPSWIWSSLLEGKSLLKEGLMWSVGNGEQINFWQDNWIPELPNAKLSSYPGSKLKGAEVSDFVDLSRSDWDIEKLQSCVTEWETQAIQKIPLSFSNRPDKLIWKHSNSITYTVKSGYHQSVKKFNVDARQPSSSFSPSKYMWFVSRIFQLFLRYVCYMEGC